jgi:predicted amidohydrolase YtcJ
VGLAKLLVWTALFGLAGGRRPAPILAESAFINANVITVDPRHPRAEAFAVGQGHFLAVGSNAEIKKLIGVGTKVVDLAGKTVTPGFIDPHLHPEAVYSDDAPFATVHLDPAHGVRTMAQLIAALKRHAALIPKGYWIRGSRYDDGKLGRHPTRFDLDQASTDHPIEISQVSGHVSAVNSLALQLSGITKETPDPAGGAYDRLPDGTPNGVCRETAGVRGSIAPSVRPTHAERLEGLKKGFENFLAKGLTSVADAAASPDSLQNYQELIAQGLPIRINVMLLYPYLDRLKSIAETSNDHLRLGTVKLFHGNSFSGRTCWVSKAYEGRPTYFGIPPKATQEELNKIILDIHAAGFQPAVHSNGDREIDMVLTAFEEAQKQLPRPDTRFRIEHCSVCTPQILERAKRDGVVLVFHSYVWENGDKLHEFGKDRYEWLAPMRRALDLGIHVTSHSDFSVSAADPLLRIQDLVTRRTESGETIGAGQVISPEAAIRVWTLNAAYATFEEKFKGSIEPGKLADFVVLGQDPTKVAPLKIRLIPIRATYIDGRQAWAQNPESR